MITSLENKSIKKYAKLKQRKYREEEGLFLVEGEHLIKEAEKANLLKVVILTEDKKINSKQTILYVTKEIMKKLSFLDTPPEVMGVCKMKAVNNSLGNQLLILDEIQDPGNLGTIIRSAVAFGIDSILLSENTVDLYNPKVVRATQGLLFHMNIVKCNLLDTVSNLKEKGYQIYTTNVENGEELKTIKINRNQKLALVMGNEGKGVREEITSLADKKIYIKMNPLVESLNVGIATSILLYELAKKR